MSAKFKSDNRFKVEAAAREEHRKQLEVEYEMTGHHKSADVYALAWSYGHSCGLAEVRAFYADLVSLVKP